MAPVAASADLLLRARRGALHQQTARRWPHQRPQKNMDAQSSHTSFYETEVYRKISKAIRPRAWWSRFVKNPKTFLFYGPTGELMLIN